MVRHLRRKGHEVGRRRVRLLMAEIGLAPIYQRPRTRDPHPSHRIYPMFYASCRSSARISTRAWPDDLWRKPMGGPALRHMEASPHMTISRNGGITTSGISLTQSPNCPRRRATSVRWNHLTVVARVEKRKMVEARRTPPFNRGRVKTRRQTRSEPPRSHHRFVAPLG